MSRCTIPTVLGRRMSCIPSVIIYRSSIGSTIPPIYRYLSREKLKENSLEIILLGLHICYTS